MGKLLAGAALLILAAAHGFAMGTKPAVTITGTIRLVGNAPFARVVLTEETRGQTPPGKEYLLTGTLTDELRQRYQGRRVTLEGTPCTSPLPQFTSCFEPARIIGE